MNSEQQLQSEREYESAKLVETLLDDAEYFSDVENFGLDKHGFTAENVLEMLDQVLQPLPWDVARELDKVDFAAVARSLNEEFGYSVSSTEVYVRLQVWRVDELDRERLDGNFDTKTFKVGDNVESFLAEVRQQLEKVVTLNGKAAADEQAG